MSVLLVELSIIESAHIHDSMHFLIIITVQLSYIGHMAPNDSPNGLVQYIMMWMQSLYTSWS